ncbi:hypothetical protein PRIPAC_78939 [Pristionchus pacificus]|uniref:G protein-coupled receptor n=1 Tax=Pristionchus pacificus TaxID=54126 RepID=A0A2A6CQW3_PRIPA|nr:hypothetical protein PRIPAC_78939 [Pristionchus pacificus]|eukprot:PDM80421.1 G protein-coupled receptor [Pristionchus pacificus]
MPLGYIFDTRFTWKLLQHIYRHYHGKIKYARYRTCFIRLVLSHLDCSDPVFQLGQMPKIVQVFVGKLGISSMTCCFAQILPNAGFSAGTILLLLIAIDRLLSVHFPSYYSTKNFQRYLMASKLYIISDCHVLAIFSYVVLHPVFCNPPEMYQGRAKELWGMPSITIIFISIVIYYAVCRTMQRSSFVSFDILSDGHDYRWMAADNGIIYALGTLSQLPLLFGYLFEMNSDLCMIIMYLPEMGVAIGVAAIFAVGLDRMLSVFISEWHRSLNKRIFHCFLAFLIIGYCASFTFLMVVYYQKRVVICGMLSPYPDTAVIWFRIINIIANGATALVYTITWLGLQVYKDAPGMKRIIKSLFLIAAADVCGWILTPAFIELIQHLNLNSNQIFSWTYCGTIFINVAMSAKLLIYYSTSSEYRLAINAFLVSTLSSGMFLTLFRLSLAKFKYLVHAQHICQVIPIFGLSTGNILVLLISMDRWISINRPTYYATKGVRHYLMCNIFVIVTFASVLYIIAYVHFEEKDVLCIPPAMYHGQAEMIWGSSSLVLCIMSIMVYYSVWRGLKKSAGWGNDMRIFRTIFSIMGMIICGWLLSFVIVIVVQALDLRDEWIVIGMEVCGLPVNLTLALNFVVLYRTSQEYRTSFLIQMKALPCIGRLIQIKKATVSPNSDKTNNVNSYS